MSMREVAGHQVAITGGFWGRRLQVNASQALPHQWAQLEQGLWLQNLRLAGGEGQGFREGFFFADSDVYKWLDAAGRTLRSHPQPELAAQVNELIGVLEKAMQPDGYLNTYNQLHFPGQRWQNLQIEHELYCLGHLIEAGIAHYEATGERRLLSLGERAADLLVRDFMDAPPAMTDGHEEIEIALLRLYEINRKSDYLELARRLLERRGEIKGYPVLFARQAWSTRRRMKERDRQRAVYLRSHPEHQIPHLPTRLLHNVPPLMPLRLAWSLFTGRYAQQDRPLHRRTEPVGHAVRFAYLQTAASLLSRLDPYDPYSQEYLLPALETCWQRMVQHRMYVSGGIGALPLIEGFGRDDELDPESAYAETCAALGCMLWNWQMTLLTAQAPYADLFEWQLYNAASVSMALDGRSYFYDNPLRSRGGLQREVWYDVPCCPSNLSRIWAGLARQVYSQAQDGTGAWVHQYISSRCTLPDGAVLHMDSALPWEGRVCITFETAPHGEWTLRLRIPSWAGTYSLHLNGSPLTLSAIARQSLEPPVLPPAACGLALHNACYLSVTRGWQPGDELELLLEMPVRLYHQSERLPGCGGMAAVGRGPLLYCLESLDQPGVDIFNLRLLPETLHPVFAPHLLDGVWTLQGQAANGASLTFIPYLYWANRGPSHMTVFVSL